MNIMALAALFTFVLPSATKTGYIDEGNAPTCIGYNGPVPQDYHILKGELKYFNAIVTSGLSAEDKTLSCRYDPVKAKLFL